MYATILSAAGRLKRKWLSAIKHGMQSLLTRVWIVKIIHGGVLVLALGAYGYVFPDKIGKNPRPYHQARAVVVYPEFPRAPHRNRVGLYLQPAGILSLRAYDLCIQMIIPYCRCI